jgi:hypothetical protein
MLVVIDTDYQRKFHYGTKIEDIKVAIRKLIVGMLYASDIQILFLPLIIQSLVSYLMGC